MHVLPLFVSPTTRKEKKTPFAMHRKKPFFRVEVFSSIFISPQYLAVGENTLK